MGRERGGRGTGARAGRCGWGAGWECGRAKACWSRAQAGVRTVAALVGRSVRPLAFCEYAAELGGCGCEGRGAPSDVSEERRAASVRVVGESAPCRRSGCGFLRGRILRGRGGERDFGERVLRFFSAMRREVGVMWKWPRPIVARRCHPARTWEGREDGDVRRRSRPMT